MRIHYAGYMTAISDWTADIPITVDTKQLKFAAIAWTLRDYYRETRGDHPEFAALLQEARQLEARAGEPYLLPRDPKMAMAIHMNAHRRKDG